MMLLAVFVCRYVCVVDGCCLLCLFVCLLVWLFFVFF